MPSPRRTLHGLNALRGVAAVAVMLMHCGYQFKTTNAFPHGYLAVDFFFMLSGFVLNHAYADRMTRGFSANALIMARIRRLYPMIILGVGLGVVMRVTAGASWGDITADAMTGVLLFPSMTGYQPDELFPINPPMWSLFWEFVASIAFARGLWRLSTSKLVGIQALSFVGLACLTTLYGTMEIGFARHHILGGAARVSFAFVTGIILHRRWRQRQSRTSQGPISCLAAALLIILGARLDIPRIWFDLISTAILFPVIIILSADVQRIAKPYRLGALISYPLYATHVPIVVMLRYWIGNSTDLSTVIGITCSVSLSLIVAILAYRYWDKIVEEIVGRISHRSVKILVLRLKHRDEGQADGGRSMSASGRIRPNRLAGPAAPALNTEPSPAPRTTGPSGAPAFRRSSLPASPSNPPAPAPTPRRSVPV